MSRQYNEIFTSSAERKSEIDGMRVETSSYSLEEIEAIIDGYDSSRMGFSKLMQDIAQSEDPRTVSLIIAIDVGLAHLEEKFSDVAEAQYGRLMALGYEGDGWGGTFGLDAGGGAIAANKFLEKNPQFKDLYALQTLKWMAGSLFDDDNPVPKQEGLQLSDIETDTVLDMEAWWGEHDTFEEEHFIARHARELFFQGAHEFSTHVLREHLLFADSPSPYDRQITNAAFDAVGQYMNSYESDDVLRYLNNVCPSTAIDELSNRLRDTQDTDERHWLIQFMGKLKGVPVAVEQARCKYLGLDINLEGETSADMATVEMVSYHGEVGVFSDKDELIGGFDLLVLQGDTAGWYALVKAFDEDSILYAHDAVDISAEDREKVWRQMRQSYHEIIEHPFFTKSGFDINYLSLREQAYLVHFLRTAPDEEIRRLETVARALRADSVRLALTTYIHLGTVEPVFDLAAHTGDMTFHFIKKLAIEQLNMAQQQGAKLHQELSEMYPSTQFDRDSIVRGCTVSIAQQLADSARLAPEEFERDNWQEFVQQFEKNATLDGIDMRIGLAFLREFMEATRKTEISLTDYEKRKQAAQAIEKHSGLKSVFVEHLVKTGSLKPIPEVHWRVDRSSQEYNRRFGVDISQLFDAGDTVLEFGPGS